MKVGIFGGSFNPAHLGHFQIVREIFKQKLVDRLIIVPAHQNPLKAHAPILPETLRWEILVKTFAEFDCVEISDVEIKVKELSYTHKTIDYFQSEFPKAQLNLIMGEDTFQSFHMWAHPEKIMAATTLLVFPRPRQCPTPLQNPLPGFGDHIKRIDCPIPDISATEIRTASPDRLRQKPMLHRNVIDRWERYLRENH
jgi:nicotinate-nucleotide adenylyltransferase